MCILSQDVKFRLHNNFVDYDSHYIRLCDYDSQNLGVLWTKKNMSVYTLLPDPSSLAIFNNVCAFFKKTIRLSTDRRYCEHKQTMAY